MILKTIIATLIFFFGVCAQAEEENITLNFVNSDIVSVIKAVGQITGKNFLIDPRVKGTINIVSSRPVSRALIYPILLSALRLQGYAAVESNGVTKILPEADAKLNYTQTTGSAPPAGGEIVTQVYVLKHQSAAQLIPVLRPLISPNNTVAAYPNSNTLVITDYADNLKRIDHIIDAIDQPSDDAVVIELHHASAIDVARIISRLTSSSNAPGATNEPGQHVSVVVDERTNSLILDSTNTSRVAMLKRLIEKLDASTGDMGNIHVIYLKNADAGKLAQTLSAVITGEPSAPTPSAPMKPPSQSSGAQSSSSSSSSPAPGSPVASSSSPGSSISSGPSMSSPPSLLQTASLSPSGPGSGMIQADTATNSLIITAPEAVYNNLRAVIDKLDERRAQIFVEALIVEVDATKAASFGIQWQDLNGVTQGGTNVIGGTNFGTPGVSTNIMSAASNIASVGQGLNIGIVKGQINIPGVGTVLNLGALASALETEDNANILSTPDLLTLDNEQAKIVVGQNIPLVTGSYAQTGTTATITPFQTYDRKDVGLTLQIKPQISEGGSIQLQIYQEVSSVDATTLNNPSGPTTNLRSIDSTVLVDDGQIIVLGGLIQDSVAESVSKVPVLGDLPYVGNLFSFKNRTRTKTDLMVFLRPHVLRNENGYAKLTSDRYDYISGEQLKTQMSKSFMLPDIKAPVLPPLSTPQQK
ncbi:MAG TPA: type II secretion system secretin GspD [Burkholderiales bacterium]|nr:type II secretion system secretin GspD [Burkholderiales bacterium]